MPRHVCVICGMKRNQEKMQFVLHLDKNKRIYRGWICESSRDYLHHDGRDERSCKERYHKIYGQFPFFSKRSSLSGKVQVKGEKQ